MGSRCILQQQHMQVQVSNQLTPNINVAQSSKIAISVLTFNILAPCYTPELSNVLLWKQRIADICDCISEIDADIVCLQEYWFDDDCVSIVESKLAQKYSFYAKKRPYGKQDGLCVLVRKEARQDEEKYGGGLEVVHSEGKDYSWAGDRVCLLVHLKLKVYFLKILKG